MGLIRNRAFEKKRGGVYLLYWKQKRLSVPNSKSVISRRGEDSGTATTSQGDSSQAASPQNFPIYPSRTNFFRLLSPILPAISELLTRDSFSWKGDFFSFHSISSYFRLSLSDGCKNVPFGFVNAFGRRGASTVVVWLCLCFFLHIKAFYFCGGVRRSWQTKKGLRSPWKSQGSCAGRGFLQKRRHLHNLSHQPYFPLLN